MYLKNDKTRVKRGKKEMMCGKGQKRNVQMKIRKKYANIDQNA